MISTDSVMIRRINLTLVVVGLLFLVYYVVQVNELAAQTWNTQAAHTQLGVLNDQHNVLVAQESSLDNRQTLTLLAQQAGLVPADTVSYLVQDHAVAIAP